MKAYSYAAKDQTGATTKGVIQAADRGAALAALKAKGLMPVSVTEGGQIPREVALPTWFSTRTLALVGLVIVLGVGVVFTWGQRHKCIPRTSESNEKQPKPQETNEYRIAVTESLKKKETKPIAPTIPQALKTDDKGLEAVPLVEEVPPPAQLPMRRVVETIPGISTNPPNTGYSSGTERLINMIVNTQLGAPPPPLPMLPPGENENIGKILESNILVFDDDDERTQQEKENVAYAKQLLKAYLAEGGTTETFLKYYHDELTKAFEEWRDAQKKMMALVKAGDAEVVAEYIEAQNKDFEERGIRQITLPPGITLSR